MNTILTIISFVLSIAYCKQETKTLIVPIQSAGFLSGVKVDSTTFSIIKYNVEWHWLFKNAKPATLTNEELQVIEKILIKSVTANNVDQQKRLRQHNQEFPKNPWTETGFELELSKFKRQYVPVINSRGEKEVWLNLFCESWEKQDWRKDILMVHDGGNCYFNLKINLKTEEYYDFFINGYA